MSIIKFIRKFPEINKKDDKYYLYFGIVSSFDVDQIFSIVEDCLEQDIFKRKILLNRITNMVHKWSTKDNNNIFNKVFGLKDSLSSYFKKESASKILIALFPYISRNNQNRLIKDFLYSKYKNNRKRIYNYFYKNWSSKFEKIIKKVWSIFRDEESIGLIVEKMPNVFLLKYFDEISNYFNEEELEYDFSRKILRNKFYARLYDKIPLEIQKLRNTDPISFIFIKKYRKEKIDISWAIKIYKQFSQSRFLARWYSEMGLWEDILKKNPKFLSEIKISFDK